MSLYLKRETVMCHVHVEECRWSTVCFCFAFASLNTTMDVSTVSSKNGTFSLHSLHCGFLSLRDRRENVHCSVDELGLWDCHGLLHGLRMWNMLNQERRPSSHCFATVESPRVF